eukprot:g4421.t1
MGHDESYTLEFNSPTTTIYANEIWGVRHALETLVQLTENAAPLTSAHTISDSPAFPWRGLLIDTSRHFLPERNILQQIEAMAMSKLNVFHWHISDAQSFPLLLESHPELAQESTHNPGQWYDASAIRRIVQFAERMGIRVVPEIDIPSHTYSWRAFSSPADSSSSIVVECSHLASPKDADRFKRQDKSTLDPTNPKTFEAIRDILNEVFELFPDKYIHLGGDEVDLRCFAPVMDRAKRDLGIRSPRALLQYFWDTVIDMVIQHDKIPIVWEGVFGQNIKIKNEIVVQAWRNWGNPVLGLVTGRRAAKAHHRVIQSTHYYLDWDMRYSDYYEKKYVFDPSGTIGGESCSWSEHVDALNIDCRIWPRASAIAERLWTGQDGEVQVNEKYAGANRRKAYEAHRDRMVSRGLVAAADGGLDNEYCGHIEQALQRQWDVDYVTSRERLVAYHIVISAQKKSAQDQAFLWLGRRMDIGLAAILVVDFSTKTLQQQGKFIKRAAKLAGLPYAKACLVELEKGSALLVAGRYPVVCTKHSGTALAVSSGTTGVRVSSSTGLLLLHNDFSQQSGYTVII